MSTGGVGWTTAGTLDLGAGNTFTVADATTDDLFYGQAWWKFTPAADAQVTLTAPDGAMFVSYTGVDEAHKVAVTHVNYGTGLEVYDVTSGVEYHVLVGTLSPSGPATYTVTYSDGSSSLPTVLHRTPWADTDNTDNFLIVSRGDLNQQNIFTNEFDGYLDWYPDVLDDTDAPIRDGDYRVQQVLGGEDPLGAAGCVLGHARYGDEDIQYWNTTTTDVDEHGDPVCRPLVPGAATAHAPIGSTVYHVSTYDNDAPLFVAASLEAKVRSRARGIWLRPVFDNLDERGVLAPAFMFDPEAEGVPADIVAAGTYDIEWEAPLELAGVQVGIDDVPPDIEYPDPTTLVPDQLLAVDVNSVLAPTYSSGWDAAWTKGAPPGPGFGSPPPMADGSTDKPSFTFYEPGDGTPGWTDYDGLDDWDKCFDKSAGDEPDIVLTTWTTGAHDGWTVGATDVSLSNPYDIAVKVLLRSARHRWVWEAPGTTVVRQFPRDDARGVSSAPRLFPLRKQTRLAGGYPGGGATT